MNYRYRPMSAGGSEFCLRLKGVASLEASVVPVISVLMLRCGVTFRDAVIHHNAGIRFGSLCCMEGIDLCKKCP